MVVVTIYPVLIQSENKILDWFKLKAFADDMLTISQGQILDSSIFKEFAEDNFKFDKNGRNLVENTGKSRNCS